MKYILYKSITIAYSITPLLLGTRGGGLYRPKMTVFVMRFRGQGVHQSILQEGNLLVTRPKFQEGFREIPLCLFTSSLGLSLLPCHLCVVMSTDEDLLLDPREAWGRPEFLPPDSIPSRSGSLPLGAPSVA